MNRCMRSAAVDEKVACGILSGLMHQPRTPPDDRR